MRRRSVRPDAPEPLGNFIVSADFSPHPEPPLLRGVTLVARRGADDNPAYGHSLRLTAGGARLEPTFELAEVPDGATLVVKHLSSRALACRNEGWSPVTITLNERIVVANHAPAAFSFLTERFRIADHAVAGTNRIAFEANELCSHYWLERFAIAGRRAPR